MTAGGAIRVDAVKIVMTLLVSQLVPLCVGLLLRQQTPALAERLQMPAARLSTAMNIIVFGAILVVQFQLLERIRLFGFAGMFLLVTAFTAIGWLLGGPDAANRRAMALSTGVRNVGVSLVIATGSFPGTPAITAALAFAIYQTIVLALAAAAWGRMSIDYRSAARDAVA